MSNPEINLYNPERYSQSDVEALTAETTPDSTEARNSEFFYGTFAGRQLREGETGYFARSDEDRQKKMISRIEMTEDEKAQWEAVDENTKQRIEPIAKLNLMIL